MNFLKQMARDMAAGYAGRINVFPNGYKFSDDGCTNAQGVWFKPRRSADGRLVSLSLGVKTANGCPEPPVGDFPKNDRGRCWVPMKFCRKCPHHIARRRGQPYPCCAVLRKMAQAGPTPAAQVADLMDKAVEKTRELMR